MEFFTEKLDEQSREGCAYSLFCARVGGVRAYILCIDEAECSAAELFDGSEARARELFALLIRENLRACHLFDVVFDFRREQRLEIL